MPNTYGGYILIDISQDYEERYAYQWEVTPGSPSQMTYTRTLMRRTVETRIYVAALPDNEPFPGIVNPDNLSPADGWHPQNVRMPRQRAQPLSKSVRETWVKYGSWTAAGPSEPVNPVYIVQLNTP